MSLGESHYTVEAGDRILRFVQRDSASCLRLPRGRYVLDVNAIDKAYDRDDPRRRGGNRVVCHVG